MTGLYVHVPFCAKKCLYCDFNSVTYDDNSANEYLNALKKELHAYREMDFNSVYIGGGTPTIYHPEDLDRMLSIIFKTVICAGNQEKTIEANPRTLNREKLRILKKYGINRLSIGAQSFNDNLLKTIGRIHNSDEFRDIYTLARDEGFRNINVDLLFAIPGQTGKDWLADLEKISEYAPEHVSAYGLTVEKDTPLYSMICSGQMKPVSEDASADMYQQTIETLESRGYVRYEISNFSKPGYECAHNINYWNMGAYAGIGAGASSFLNGERRVNEKNISEYIKRILQNGSAVSQKERISSETAVKEEIMLGLRKAEGIDEENFRGKYGVTVADRFADAVKNNISLGFLKQENGRLSLTEKGLLVANSVIIDFF